ncbi:tRNA (adenosine(37)-N6)-threonylcarbamoyltransferase complex dimerization subunit type 1 TsaB [Aminithiophilus ramosus]|uniref:N(6)-L-threonylcarbamoyladenine synthase n=2 Tax=Synergistales TaxID=649776 RepID=A0A9Q7F0Z5_9BACT|nr:tRNA (adenosine(37)-N6)-threonylcarbamoyltransferase complex dimerization subunit type 1 TsaB [Aminithiophilus ramosus]QTX33507.1 tRNA (adenosine(37)-N6)-threonylcarbamoyltransferase complex dimerization subunit type 1 TsaB [Aminithiophilus ramosus]QVL37362.1 tRNA (adenosine(37)-N6)-threonylcarbamoyltransferase complex dimerization subunit type 1 TsaB [Synergistota bacterium]
MPFVLSIDCCSRWTNVGCSCNGTILGEVHLNIGRNQSSQLPLVVEGLLRSIDKTFHDVDFLAVTTGPGYFTGLRVGVAYAMALAEALNVPVVPVNTLEAMIFDLLHEGPLFLPLLWARRDEVYGAIYRASASSSTPEPLLSPVFIPFNQLLEFSREQKKRVLWVGEDLHRFASSLDGESILSNRASARAGNVALLGERDADRALPVEKIVVDYFRGADMG